ncbi:MAG: GntR family transcriptional regulator [Nitrospira sp.]|nr:GntR family transcriptional regulator [Nitrospira sp.]
MKKVAHSNARRTKRDPSNLSSSVVATLKEQIVHWHYSPEHRLTEDELCKTFGVSRSPVREALRVLASDGFVKKLPNRGYVVKQYTIEEIEELYEVRLALELYTVERLATKKQTTQLAAELTDLAQTWTELSKESSKKPDEFAILDTLFHDTLARALGNASLLRTLRTINERLTLFRMLDFEKPDRAEHTCRQHLKILERIMAQDAPGARAAMQKNIEEGRRLIPTTIKEALASAYLRRAVSS